MATYNKRGYKAPKPKEVSDLDNEFEDSITNGESTTEEVFNNLDEGANKLEDWVAENQKVIMGVVGAIALFTIGYLLYGKFVAEPKAEESFNKMYQAQAYFNDALNTPEKADSLFNLALKGGDGQLGFVAIAEDYSSSDAGNLANYYAGMAYLQIKDFKNAETFLLKYDGEDMITKATAYGGLGDAYAETNKVEDAISYYKKAAEANANDYTTPRFLNKAAQLAFLNNKKEEANKLFKQIKEKYETSREAVNIDAYIAMTE